MTTINRPLRIEQGDMVFEPWISNETIRARVGQLAGHIATRFSGEPVRFVPILRGAKEFGAMLVDMVAEAPNGPSAIDVDPIKVKSYQGTESGELQWHTRPEFEGHPRVHTILVEDIADTARTLTTVEDHFRQQAAASLTTVVLLDRPASRADGVRDYQPDLVGFEIDDPDAWAIGFGLDLDERYRQLPDIYGRLGPNGETPPPYRMPPFPEIA